MNYERKKKGSLIMKQHVDVVPGMTWG